MAYKASRQRDMVYTYMQTLQGHVAAEQIYQDLKNSENKISLATVYRNLNILADMEMIKKIALPDGYVYDKTCNPHYHFYCTKCQTLYDLPHAYDEYLHQEIDAQSMVGEIKSHEITFKGICKNCIK